MSICPFPGPNTKVSIVDTNLPRYKIDVRRKTVKTHEISQTQNQPEPFLQTNTKETTEFSRQIRTKQLNSTGKYE
jgi:hypothetical protein